MSNENASRVLVTGGSGFLGGWVILALLKRGHRVRATMRSHERENELRTAIASHLDVGERLEVSVANLLEDAGWNDAMDGVNFVQHIASPMPTGEFRDQDLISPAREGTLRVLRAAERAGVRRMVVTSSAVAAFPDRPDGYVFTEADWTDVTVPTVSKYAAAKTLAEQDAWAFVANSTNGMTLTTILPGAIQGPLLTPDLSGWAELILRMLKGKLPLLPRVGMGMVDVRDLAELHVRAMEAPAAAGQRFLAANDFVWFAEVAQILRDELGEAADKVKTNVAPDWLVRVLALFNSDLRQLVPTLGKRKLMSGTKAAELLEWRGRPLRQSFADAGSSILAFTKER